MPVPLEKHLTPPKSRSPPGLFPCVMRLSQISFALHIDTNHLIPKKHCCRSPESSAQAHHKVCRGNDRYDSYHVGTTHRADPELRADFSRK